MAEAAEERQPEKKVSTQKAQANPKGRRKVRVRRYDHNKNKPICVTINHIKNSFHFMPGELIELPEEHIQVLKDAVIENRFPIPEDSAIYQAGNPIAEAQRQNPGFRAELDARTATIYLKRSIPQYLIEDAE